MAQPVCLLCLTDGRTLTSMEIGMLYELLKSVSLHCYRNHPKGILSQFVEDDCFLCGECALLINETEEVERQISKLEDQLRSNVSVIKAKLSHSPESSNDPDLGEISYIREALLHLTGGDDDDGYDYADGDVGNNACQMEEEVQIKIEPDEDENDRGAPEFLEDDSSPMEEMEHGKEESDTDSDTYSAFYITPDHVGTTKSKRKRLERNVIKTKVSHSGKSKNDGKQPNKKRPPTILKRESHPRTVKTPLLSHREGGQKHVDPQKSVKHSKTKQVGRRIMSRNSDVTELKSENQDSDDIIDPRPFKCDSCSCSFMKEDTLTQHVERAHRFPCRLCDLKFRSMTSRRTHLKQKHHSVPPYECSICSKTLRSDNNLTSHMITRHETGPKIHSCSQCDKKFSLQLNLERHFQTHQDGDNKSFVCDVCEARFASQKSLDRHLSTIHHNKSVACKTCGKICANKDTLKIHIRTHTGERPYQCDHCEERFPTTNARRSHFLLVHDSNGALSCTHCDKKFTSLSHLRTHMDRHEGIKKFTCDKCGEKFMDTSILQSHQIRDHNEPQLICEECGATFVSKPGLKRHQKAHSGVKPFKCDTCGAAFILKTLLVQHMRSHTGERPFTCEHCGKSFKARKHLYVHVQRIHTKNYVTPKNFKCPHCEKAFPSNCFMQAHIRSVHTGERPFVCHLCGKGFAINTVLTLHLKGTHKLQVHGKGWHALGKSKRDDFSGNGDSDGGDQDV